MRTKSFSEHVPSQELEPLQQLEDKKSKRCPISVQQSATLGLGDPELMELNFGSGSVDFITEGDTTLAVLQQGPYAPGVQETLIIVARELNKLA